MKDNTVQSTSTRWAVWRKFLDPAYVVLLIAIAVAVSFIITLSRDKARLRAELVGSSGTLCGPQSAQVGDVLPAFKAAGMDGNWAEVRYDGSHRYLIIIFSPSCGVCDHELPTWNRCAKTAESVNITVRGMSIDPLSDTRSNLKDKQVDFETFIVPSMSIQRAYRAVSIPQIMIVSPQGFVEWVQYGAMTSGKEEELLSKLRTG